MTVRTLICVCGSSVAIGLASVAAHQDTTQPERTTTTSQPELTTRTTSTGQVEDLLSKREGVWQVEVQLNKDYWSKMGGSGAHTNVDQTYITEPGERDRTPPDVTGDPDPTDQADPSDPTNPDEQDDPANPWYNQPERETDTTQPGQIDRRESPTTSTTTQPGMTSLNGYAEANLVLDSNCLQERIVVPAGGDMNLDSRNVSDPNQDRQPDDLQTDRPSTDAMGAAMDQGGYRAISFLQFNEDTNTYDMVFLSNHTEGMKYESGYFDAQRNRIVFRGKHDASGMRSTTDWKSREPSGDQPSIDWKSTDDPSKPAPGEQTDTVPDYTNRDPSDPSRTDPSRTDPTLTDPTRTTQTDRMHSPSQTGLKDVVVVLEFIDDDTHKVTMYDASSTGGQMDWRTDPSRDMDLDTDIDTDLDTDIDSDLDTDVDIDDDIDDDRDLNDELEDDRDDALDEEDIDDVQDEAERDWRTQPDTTRMTDRSMQTSSEFGKIIYQATYTRAPSSMEASIRSMIDREITVASR